MQHVRTFQVGLISMLDITVEKNLNFEISFWLVGLMILTSFRNLSLEILSSNVGSMSLLIITFLAIISTVYLWNIEVIL